MFALVDCNSFYASCEKVFRPDLRDKAVVVLSNNDGCLIARSKEAKQLGYKMGEPYFKVKDQLQRDGVIVFSSNYALYQDLSNRVMATLELICPDVEVYSIDEAFLHLKHYPYACNDFDAYASEVKRTVEQHTGIPVGVGIAPTKTLSKLANHWAKKQDGLCVIRKRSQLHYYLENTPTSDIWGIGNKLTARLANLGITNAFQLAYADKKWLRKHYSVMLERTARELSGERCYDLEPPPEPKKEIVVSRSFGKRITEKDQLMQAVATHVTRACEKLRSQDSHAKRISVFFRTGMFNDKEEKKSQHASMLVVNPTADTRIFLKLAMQLVEHLWLDGFRWAKAGVMITDISQNNPYQADLFFNVDSERGDKLMDVLDAINQRYGSHSAIIASQGTHKPWSMSRDMLSPCYTTKLSDIPVFS